MEKEKNINRIKVVLVEKQRTNKWLAQQLGKDPATVSKWCTNTSQPGLETLLEIYKPQNKMFHFCKTFCSKITLINTIQNVILNPI